MKTLLYTQSRSPCPPSLDAGAPPDADASRHWRIMMLSPTARPSSPVVGAPPDADARRRWRIMMLSPTVRLRFVDLTTMTESLKNHDSEIPPNSMTPSFTGSKPIRCTD